MASLEVKSIGELLDIDFFIPSYQRGYRWTERQVTDLLNDVWDFVKKPDKMDTEWYCLQPIVIRANNSANEVLDGQQRLTTIFLVLKHLERFIESENKSFGIEYETRNTDEINSKKFLDEIEHKSQQEAEANIDYFHIYKAYNIIKTWFSNRANEGERSISSKFITPFLEKAKVIWYEVKKEKDEVEIFTRINMGKIPLTNAELIKALFLNSSNFPSKNSNEIKLRQLEIASEWDRIELALQNPELWFFLNNPKRDYPNRIEYIFEIIEALGSKKSKDDEYSSFHYFLKKFNDNRSDNTDQQKIDRIWGEVKVKFQIIEEWFSDRTLYHKIGFLVTTGTKLQYLLVKAENNNKKEFMNIIDKEIKDILKLDDDKELEDLEYGKDSKKIKYMLIFHNIKTMLDNKNETSRFPFDRLKKEEWDIEHIHAVQSMLPEKKEGQIKWLKNSQEFVNKGSLNDEILTFIENYDIKMQSNNESFINMANKVIQYFASENVDDEFKADINDLSNLVLLDRETNRSYKNAIFPKKRSIIIEREKNDTFVPICTKNAFLKYHTENPNQLITWGTQDRRSYINDLKSKLDSYL